MSEPTETESDFRVGDNVSWMHYVATRGTSMGFKTRRGRIFAIVKGMAYVKLSNGRQTHVLLSSLDKKGEMTELTKLAMGIEREPVHNRIEQVLRLLPEVQWDRWAGDFARMGVFGWVDRHDGRHDFVHLVIEGGVVVSAATSSAEHSTKFATRLGLDGHCECKRVENSFNVENCVRL